VPDRDPTQNPIRSERPTLPSRPREASEVERFTDSFEVVVVGLGVAGGAAAIEAARAGARTLVLERATRGGGATALSEGTIYFGGGTRVQQAAGFEDDLEKMMTHVRAAAGPSSDPEKVRLYCENSLDHFEFFCGLGVEFKDSFYPEKAIFPPTDDCLMFSGNEEAHPFSTESPPVPRGHKPRREGPAGGYIIERMIETLGELGVEIRNETRVETLVQDDDGRVIGVVARHGDEEIAIEATRGVILTTGGFIMNREMVEHFAPDLARCRYPIGSEGCDGSGIRMGIGVGGAAINMHEGLMTTPWYPPASHVRGLIVNARGQRFINEDCYHGRVADAVMHKADGRAYLVVDDATYGKTMIPYEMVAVEETIEALEKSLDMPEGQLVHTVATYNRDAGRGEDTLLHKASKYLQPLSQPPFAALDLSVDKCLWAAFTLGGLDTRPSGEVLTVDGEVVPGLYAAGRASAGLTRSGRYYASGMSIGGSSFFGRLAGRTAAKAAPR
jgi:succinate dehydrogenase/fumarate reductase flavoprotein subunit